MAIPLITRTAVTSFLALAITGLALPDPGPSEPSDPEFAVTGDAEAYAWSSEVFATAGLDAPRTSVTFHTSDDACGGTRGRAWLGNPEVTDIAVCATHPNPVVEDAWRRRTLLHEMAHAWISQNVSPDTMSEFVEQRGLKEWSSHKVEWAERGTEHAAEILMWGMQAGAYEVDFRIREKDCGGLAAGYETLTGHRTACPSQTLS